jgi:hypothetical protein
MESKLQQGYLDVKNADSIDMLRIEVQDVLGRLRWKDQVLLKMRMSGMSYSQYLDPCLYYSLPGNMVNGRSSPF